ncbi:hypothetical protein BDZ45DRAFT_749457 [Acephala macrosclerotiorum]|nr:hypothetical protein BDZ45DRAFT_749457 [Acephala macrosclerotiorum]
MKASFILFASAVLAGPIIENRAATTSAMTPYPTGTLPDPITFAFENGTKWHISNVGTIYSSTDPRMGWDNGRTSVLDNTLFWNFGDVLSLDGLQDGFSTGPAFYGTPDDMLRVDMKNITNVLDLIFAEPAPSDPVPQQPTPFWGLSTSNVAEISPGVGIGFVWEVWRDTTGTRVDRGLGIFRATLGDELPIANRTGPLVTGPDAIEVGIMTVMNAEGYIYTYTNGGPTGIIVGRALVADAFDINAYEFLRLDNLWIKGVPNKLEASLEYGVQGIVHSDGQGSIMWSNYFEKYILFTSSYGSTMMFSASDTPYGPWTGLYELENIPGYGVNVHPFWSPDGSHKTLYLSSGQNNIIHMYKLEFEF